MARLYLPADPSPYSQWPDLLPIQHLVLVCLLIETWAHFYDSSPVSLQPIYLPWNKVSELAYIAPGKHPTVTYPAQ